MILISIAVIVRSRNLIYLRHNNFIVAICLSIKIPGVSTMLDRSAHTK